MGALLDHLDTSRMAIALARTRLMARRYVLVMHENRSQRIDRLPVMIYHYHASITKYDNITRTSFESKTGGGGKVRKYYHITRPGQDALGM